MFRRVLQHLLPTGRAWRAAPGSNLDKLLTALGTPAAAFRAFVDRVLLDIEPETTRKLDDWERQFGLRARDLSEDDRRVRLRGEWAAVGGQSPRYIQDVLQAAGFDLYVYEWWVPGSGVTDVLSVDGGVVMLDDGTVLAVQSEPEGLRVRDPSVAIGLAATVQCGEPGAQCGEPEAQCGGTPGAGYMLVNRGTSPVDGPPPPEDPDEIRFVLYIGSDQFGVPAQIPEARRDDLESLLLRICPTQQWLAVMAQYTQED